MSYVYPRLPAPEAFRILEQIRTAQPADLADRSSTSHPLAAPVASGGSPVPSDVIRSVAKAVRELAAGLGYPAPLTRQRAAAFDVPCGQVLLRTMRIVPADAAADGVWSFLTLVALPDVALWRFPDAATERMVGRPRNVFRRVWWREYVLGSDATGGPPDGPAPLGEDEMVNIMERPTLSANPQVARALARGLRAAGPDVGSRSELMRDVAKRLLRTMAYLSLDAVTDRALDELVAELCLTAQSVRRSARLA